VSSSARERGRLLRRWEDLPAGVQVGIVAPISLVLLFVVHVTLLNQPLGRAVGYAFFWGALATGAIVGATRSERAKRQRQERDGPEG
jgi:hypothetical protein